MSKTSKKTKNGQNGHNSDEKVKSVLARQVGNAVVMTIPTEMLEKLEIWPGKRLKVYEDRGVMCVESA